MQPGDNQYLSTVLKRLALGFKSTLQAQDCGLIRLQLPLQLKNLCLCFLQQKTTRSKPDSEQ